MGERNADIQKSIEDGRVPLLPFEILLAQQALTRHMNEQSDLGRQLGEMMQQSSETWHDNAPAEAIANDAKILTGMAEKAIIIVREGQEYSYESDDDRVSLGSIVKLRYGDEEEISHVLITGVASDVPESIIEYHLPDESKGPEIECATLTSPVGLAVFDKSPGDTVHMTVNNRVIELTIEGVHQLQT